MHPKNGHKKVEEGQIKQIKEGVDLVSLVRSRGVSLKKNGKSYKCACPFHEDDDPSFSVNPGIRGHHTISSRQ